MACARPSFLSSSCPSWVAEKTANKIPDLFAEGAIDRRARLVVTNAVYFKGRWSAPFPKDATKDEPWKAAANRTVNVPTMHTTAQLQLGQVGKAKVLGMRYDGSQLAMIVVLPDDVAGLAKLEESLSPETFDSWAKALSGQRVAVSLPRFAFTWGGPLDTQLQDLGIRTAFSGKADFSGIADPASSERLQISRVVQKTWVSADEIGTEAAAASGGTMMITSANMGPIAEFKADHPFLFFVYDARPGRGGRILFAGRVTNPKS